MKYASAGLRRTGRPGTDLASSLAQELLANSSFPENRA